MIKNVFSVVLGMLYFRISFSGQKEEVSKDDLARNLKTMRIGDYKI